MLVHRFKSTANFDLRRRTVVAPVERATFVVFSLDAVRCAAPVEIVDRILRVIPEAVHRPAPTIPFRGEQVPVTDFRQALHLPTVFAPQAHSRLIVFSMLGDRRAIMADAVHEVATVDASLIRQLPTDTSGWWFSPIREDWPTGTRGIFVRHGHEVVILDILRLTRQ